MTRGELEAALEATDELEGETLRDLSLSGAEWRKKRFEGCRFERCTLDRATLRGGVFTECELEGCDLTMLAAYDVAFRDVRFTRCKLMGVDWSLAYALGFEVAFEGCQLRYASFAGMSLRGLLMRDCVADEAVFTGADLRDACLRGSRFAGATFQETTLIGADLRDAEEVVIDPRSNTLGGTKLSLDAALRAAAFLGVEVPELEG